MAKRKASRSAPRRRRSSAPRGKGKGPGPLLLLGAGAAAWLVWNLTKPTTASAATTPSLPSGSSSSPTPDLRPPTSSSDPHPDWPLLSQAHASTGPNVATWQAVLVKGGFLPNEPKSTDGIFGPLTTAATKLLQGKGNVGPDGVVGPLTRAAATRLNLW